MYSLPEISFDELTGRGGSIGLIVLKRTQVLNALNGVMLNAIAAQLAEWENASQVKAVVIRSAGGRAFCAGGDIRMLYEHKQAGHFLDPAFFRGEYRLNHQIRVCRKPWVALLDGITMGGGAGISIHGSHRVATDSLVFAMPETGIGFFPDVGMTHVFSRLPHAMGRYLGLTGVRINRADCMALGLVDVAVSPESFPELLYALADASFEGNPQEAVSSVLAQFGTAPGKSLLWEQRERVAACFSENSMTGILKALEKEGSDWAAQTAETLLQKSPLSLKVTLRALERAVESDFETCLETEFTLLQHFLQGHDFFEGIRAAVIDRDHCPVWQPATLKEVTAKKTESYFVPGELSLFSAPGAAQ